MLKAHYEMKINAGVGLGYITTVGAAIVTSTWLTLPAPLVFLSLAPGAYLIVRAFMWRVTVSHDAVVIAGLWRTRTIRRDAVVEVTDFPSVRWTASDGSIRQTRLFAFAQINGRISTRARAYNAASIMTLRRLLAVESSAASDEQLNNRS